MKNRNTQRGKRHIRIRAKITGTAVRPRLNVFRSNYGFYVQLIDDEAGKTLIGHRIEGKTVAKATEIGTLFAQKAIKANIKTIVFDRGGYTYHGSIQALAEALRKGGVEF